ncbi:Hypothetical predicted protein [Lecanosticta acicola]|uniref:Uncharacterized protein n=1 Tax=Lecanosticta acicola TaxID=111012 RepID=A0AAI8W1N5_9PEZI|nr:Hypothetical predicted protein [Lecanosticta acicola]
MDTLKSKIEQKLGDHPNVSADADVDPTSGVARETHEKSPVQQRIEAGQGYGTDESKLPQAGNTTAPETTSAGSASGAIAEGKGSDQLL